MNNYLVYVAGYFSAEVEVEANSESEAREQAARTFESDWQVVNSYAYPWDGVEIESIEEET